MTGLILATFDWVPEMPRGYVRDLRWALEEAGCPPTASMGGPWWRKRACVSDGLPGRAHCCPGKSEVGFVTAVSAMGPRVKPEGDKRGSDWRTATTSNTPVIAGLDPAIHGSASRDICISIEVALPFSFTAKLSTASDTLINIRQI